MGDNNDVGAYIKDEESDPEAFEYSSELSKLADVLDTTLNDDENSQSALENFASDIVEEQIENKTNEWLSGYGTVGVEIELDYLSDISSAEFDFLAPIYQSGEDKHRSVVYSQSGFVLNDDNNYNGRDFIHTGLGFREQLDHLMWGLNIFVDKDLDNDHLRGSVGSEFSNAYLNLASNVYFPLSDWKESSETFTNLTPETSGEFIVERAAYGLDLQATGLFSNNFPWLTWETSYGAYFGDYIEVSDGSDPDQDVYLFTAGVNYTPVPLVNFSFDFEDEKNVSKAFNAGMNLEYQLGVPLKKQIDPSQVRSIDQFDSQLLRLVKRDHNIRLQYEKRMPQDEELESAISFKEEQVAVAEASSTLLEQWVELSVPEEDIASFRFEGSASAHIQKGASILASSFVAPNIVDGSIKANLYDLSISATLKNGQTVTTASLLPVFTRANVIYDFVDPQQHTLSGDRIASASDSDGYVISAKLVNQEGRGIANRTVMFTTNGSEAHFVASNPPIMNNGDNAKIVSVKTDPNGLATTTLKNLEQGIVDVKVLAQGATSIVSQFMYVADDDIATSTVEIEVTDNFALADGKALNQFTVGLLDKNGNALVGKTISIDTVRGSTVTPLGTGITDVKGNLYGGVSSLQKGPLVVRATYGTDIESQIAEATVVFGADRATSHIERIVGTTGDVPADGQESHDIVVLVQDDNGNAVMGSTVNFSATSNAAITSSVKTNAKGVAVTKVTSTVAGNVNVTAQLSGSQNTSDTNVSFVPDNLSQKISEFEVVSNSAVADGTQVNSASVLVLDRQDNPVEGASVEFTSNNGATFPQGSTLLTGKDGLVTADVSHTQRGVSMITATLNSISTKPLPLSFVSDQSTAKIESFDSVSQGDKIANNSDAHFAEVLIVDCNLNPVANHLVTFSSNSLSATISPMSVQTGTDGIARIEVVSKEATTVKLTAEIQNHVTASLNVDFIADVTTAEVSSLSVVNNNSVANGSDTNVVVAALEDINGNPVEGQLIDFTGDPDFLFTPLGNGMTDALGNVTVEITSLVATVGDVNASYRGARKTDSITFISDVTTAKIGAMYTSVNDVLANGSDEGQVLVAIVDANNNPVPTSSVALSTSSATATLNPSANIVTNSKGIARVGVADTTKGVTTIEATHNSDVQRSDVRFISDSNSARIAYISTPSGDVIADGNSKHFVRVVITDVENNPLVGEVINFSVTNGGTVTTSDTTDNYGVALAEVTNTISGLADVTAELLRTKEQRTVSVNFVTDNANANIVAFEVLKNQAVADGNDKNKVRVLVHDRFGNSASGEEVSFSSDNGAVITPDVLNTDASGFAEVEISHLLRGPSFITATHEGVKTSSLPITFLADSNSAKVDSLVVTTSGDKIADNSDFHTIEALILDDNNNPINGQQVTFSTTTTKASVTATSVTNINGIALAEVRSTSSGDVVVEAVVKASTKTASMSFIADKLTGSVGSMITVDNDALADGTDSNRVEVQLLDKFSNPIVGEVVSFSSESGFEITPDVASTTNTSGYAYAEVKSTNAISGEVVASYLSTTDTTTVNFVPTQGSLDNIVISNNKVIADGLSTAQLSVFVKDTNGNPVPKADITLTSNSQTSSFPSGATVTTNHVGVALATVSDTKQGITNVTATYSGTSMNAPLLFVADKSSSNIDALNSLKTSVPSDGVSKHTIEVKVSDRYGNPVKGEQLSVTSTSNSAVIPKVEDTDINGVTEIFVSNTIQETSTIDVMLAGSGNSDSIAIDFGAVPIIASVTRVTNRSVADNIQENEITVLIQDKSTGSPIDGENVLVSSSNKGFTILSPILVTTGGGKATARISSTLATAADIKFTLLSTGEDIPIATEFVADISTAQPQLKRLDGSNDIIADNISAAEYQVVVVDYYRNPVPGAKINVSASVGTPDKSSFETDQSGEGGFKVAATDVGNADILVLGQVSNLDDEDTVSFVPELATATPHIAVTTNDSIADGIASNLFDLTLKDQYDNLVAGETVDLTASNNAMVVANVTTDSLGQKVGITVTDLVAEDVTITAVANSSSNQYTASMSFIANAATGTPVLTRLNGSDDVIANGSNQAIYQVTVTDNFGNLVEGEVLTLSTDGLGDLSSPTVVTDSNGKARFDITSNAVGDAVVTVVDTTSVRQDSTDVAFVPDIMTTRPVITVNEDGALANGADENSFDVILVDSNGHPIVRENVELKVVMGNAKLSTALGVTDSNGVISGVTLTNDTAETVTVEAVSAMSSLSAIANFTFVSNHFPVSVVSSSGGYLNLAPSVTFGVKSPTGVAAQQVNVTLNVTGNKSETLNLTTDSSGEVTYTPTGRLFYGHYNVTLSVDGADDQSQASEQLFITSYDPLVTIESCLDDGDTFWRVDPTSQPAGDEINKIVFNVELFSDSNNSVTKTATWETGSGVSAGTQMYKKVFHDWWQNKVFITSYLKMADGRDVPVTNTTTVVCKR